MIVGTGLIAQTFLEFRDDAEVLIFASGVSNSTENSDSAYRREFDLVKRTLEFNPKLKFVYFSTVSINDASVNERQYNSHKLKIEDYIKTNSNCYLILRVSNVVGPKGNPNTIMNFLVNAVKSDDKITIWKKAERNIIDKDDLFFIVKSLLEKGVSNDIVNVAARNNVLVLDILKQIEMFFNKKANYNLINKGNRLNIDVSFIEEELKIIEDTNGVGLKYVSNLLKKYYE